MCLYEYLTGREVGSVYWSYVEALFLTVHHLPDHAVVIWESCAVGLDES